MSELYDQMKASLKAQGVTNVAPGEGAPKQHTYDDLTNQVTKLWDQLKTASTDAEIEALGKKVAEIEAEIAKRVTKKGLTQKLNELSKKMSESADAAEAESAGDEEKPEAESAESARFVHGKGIISTEELDNISPSAPWFKDMLTANARQKKLSRASFSG